MEIIHGKLKMKTDVVTPEIQVVYWEEESHGYWEDCSNGWMCSVCNRDNRYDEDICPHCGAIMDLKYKEEED